MSRATRATVALAQAGLAFTMHDDDDPARVMKTPMALVDGRAACVIVPSDCAGCGCG